MAKRSFFMVDHRKATNRVVKSFASCCPNRAAGFIEFASLRKASNDTCLHISEPK
jgi:hypothetical protein